MMISREPAAVAAPIHYIFEGTASGSLEGTRFDNTAFRIVAKAETANRGVSSDRYTIAVDRATVGLADLGIFEFVGPRFITLIPNSSWVSLTPTSDREGFFSPIDASLASWDFISPIGPIFGGGLIDQRTAAFETSGGALVFDQSMLPPNSVPMTFRAIVLPEPCSLLLGVAGMVAACGFLRKTR